MDAALPPPFHACLLSAHLPCLPSRCVWTTTVNVTDTVTAVQGGTAFADVLSTVLVDEDGSVILAGYTSGSWTESNAGEEDYLVIKLDSDGKEIWVWQVRLYIYVSRNDSRAACSATTMMMMSGSNFECPFLLRVAFCAVVCIILFCVGGALFLCSKTCCLTSNGATTAARRACLHALQYIHRPMQ